MTYKKEAILFKVEGVNLAYDGKQILRDINFEIHDIVRPNISQGQVVSLIGRSGIGKTQLFKILAGLKSPNSGTVKIGFDQRPVKAGDVGVVTQNYVLFNHRTVIQNFQIAINNSGQKLTDTEKKKIIDQYASEFDLDDSLKKYPMQLSGGQRQRVSIIQQILAGNLFILLDEPFSGLDVIMKDKVIELLLKVSVSHEQTTLVIVSHDIESSLAISDTAFILAKHEANAGATITDIIDLCSLDLAWRHDIKTDAKFVQLVAELKKKL